MFTRMTLSLWTTLALATGCDQDSGLESIEMASPSTSSGQSCDPNTQAVASFENNFGLKDFCVAYKDDGGGMTSFVFSKDKDDAVGTFAISLPHTAQGHVFNYNTRDLIRQFELSADHCEMFKSSSRYPLVQLIATDGKETVKASSLDCDKENYFDVTVNTLQVAEKAGDRWIYELSAQYARAEKGPYYLKGKFEVERR